MTMLPVGTSFSRRPVIFSLGGALALAALIFAVEYFFRHYVLFWLPVIGNLLVNDMLALLLAYSLLSLGVGWLLGVNWRQELTGIRQAGSEGMRSWRLTAWILVLVLCIRIAPLIDQALWGHVKLPMYVSAYRNPQVWLAGAAALLKPIALVGVNGLFVPLSEEYLWRGVIQARMTRFLFTPIAIGLTALLFSLKHALVDASLGRLLTLFAFGLICGIVAYRSRWHRSAVLHLFVNTVLTATSLILSLD